MQNMLSMLNRTSVPILKQPRLPKPITFPFLFSAQKRDSKRDKKILVDASAMQIHNIIQQIVAKIEQGYIFIMTPTNRAEINLLTTYEKPDQSSNNAAAFLELESKYPKSFVNVNDFSRLKDPDSRIICFGLLNKVEIWTADGGMKDRASALGWKVNFLDSKKLNPSSEKKGTFWQAMFEGDSLLLSNKQTIRSIMIIREKKAYINPQNGFALKINDKILVLIKKVDTSINKEYIAFAAYTVISISATDNVTIDYTHRFYDRFEPKNLKNDVYRVAILNYIDTYLPDFPDKCAKPIE